MSMHTVTIDNQRLLDTIAFKAFCEDCSWCGDHWHYADDSTEEAAETDAEYDATQHKFATAS